MSLKEAKETLIDFLGDIACFLIGALLAILFVAIVVMYLWACFLIIA